MSAGSIAGLIVLVIFITLLATIAVVGRKWPANFRRIPAFDSLNAGIERAVEAGERVHVSLGTGSVIGPESAPALAGLAVLSKVTEATTMSDRPAVVTSGDGAMAILAQDTLRSAYARVGARSRYHPTSGRMLGPTPFSYVAGLPMILATEGVSLNLLMGSFGSEGALAADFGARRHTVVIAGTDDVPSQALLYATAEAPLIGEEVFAGGAYLNLGPMHRASLRTQDIIRLLVLAAILIGTVLRTLGLLP